MRAESISVSLRAAHSARRTPVVDRVVGEFPVPEKMDRVLAEMLRAELVRGTVEIAR
jgi:hypothetical protein